MTGGLYGRAMRVVVIGGTGHIGTFLVPSLVRAGHDVVAISRGARRAYRDDAAWVEANVRRLTAKYEGTREAPWSVDDAPEAFIAGQIKAIVGIEIIIDRVEGKTKLSQNRSDADIAGAIDGLEARGEHRVSAAMRGLGRGPAG